MEENKLIIVIGSIGYGNPFTSLGKVTDEVRLLLKKPYKVRAVIFTGGEDVSPYLYGGRETRLSYSSRRRDNMEGKIFKFCLKHNIKMMGICRGFQFLNVMAGGKMFQHVNRHAGSIHQIFYPAIEKQYRVNSLHHQMVILPKNAIIVGWSSPNMCSTAYDENGIMVEPPKHEIEAAVFPKYNSMGVQFHPEMMKNSEEGRISYIEMVKNFLELNINNFINTYGYIEGEENVRQNNVSISSSR